ncbi:MAG: hypothetical protein IPL52_11600 [Flavobacteriales bacterium]|nr:hypothetical protein [Flavobacteriales bacterium]
MVELQLDTLWDAVLWSDGSAFDLLVVSAPGVYCGCGGRDRPQADTIVVQQVLLPPLELGPDTSLCTGAVFLRGCRCDLGMRCFGTMAASLIFNFPDEL